MERSFFFFWVVTFATPSFFGVPFSGTPLREADLGITILHRANPIEADLRKASEANLSEARYSNQTLWPEGYETKGRGLILVEG